MKSNNYGMITWSGRNVQWPTKLPDTELCRQESIVRYHYNFNVVTFGYTMPYFDWERWQKEIDWMALHGVDLPLSYSGFEAIATRVWRKFNLTDEEIDNYFVGPAFLPWNRMGNIINHDGTITEEYKADQVELQHKILNSLKKLGMTPICPAFAGFIPRGVLRLYPDIKHYDLYWNNFPEHSRATLLSPEEDLFITIGEMFVSEYEKEFGTQEYYISDTFNEMDIPWSDDRYSWLATMGQRLYKSIANSSPNATWVIQGWMFSNERWDWDQGSTSSFLSLVPNDKMLILDLATDYNEYIYHNEFNWDYYDGFYGKKWVYSVIPNMGGKCQMTGVLDYYRKGHLTPLNDTKKGNLVGMGMAPEGFENNEIVYEIYTDVYWSSEEKKMEDLLYSYAMNRYGSFPDQINKTFDLLLKSAYGQLIDHPRYNWQFRPARKEGTAHLSDEFVEACRLWVFASVENKELEKSELYKTDAIEASIHLACIKLENICKRMIEAFDNGDKQQATYLYSYFDNLIHMVDHVLENHATLRLGRWLYYAEKMAGDNEELKKHYKENGRLIVSLWSLDPDCYGSVGDYAAKLWSGLLRDYYFRRWEIWYKGRMNDREWWEIEDDIRKFESEFVLEPELSRVPKPKDVFKVCRDLVTFTDSIDLDNFDWW